MASIRKHLKEIRQIVERFTSDHSIELTNGSHVSILLRHNGGKRTVFAPLTPSDRYAMLDVKRKVKLAYNELATA